MLGPRPEFFIYSIPTRMKCTLQDPSLGVLKETGKSLRNFENPRCSKRFQGIEEVNDSCLKQERIFEIGHQSIPPWLVLDIVYCYKDISKKNQTEEKIKAKIFRR